MGCRSCLTGWTYTGDCYSLAAMVPYAVPDWWCRLEIIVSDAVKFSEDVVPLGDMKVNPGKVVRRVHETHRPVLLTGHGRGVAVV